MNLEVDLMLQLDQFCPVVFGLPTARRHHASSVAVQMLNALQLCQDMFGGLNLLVKVAECKNMFQRSMDVHGLVVGTNKDEYDSEAPSAVAVADFVRIQNLINRY